MSLRQGAGGCILADAKISTPQVCPLTSLLLLQIGGHSQDEVLQGGLSSWK